MRRRYAFHPEEYAIGENEGFYSEMAAKGWRLNKRGVHLSRFERTQPVEELYRIEIAPSSFGESGLSDEQLALYEECGWEYVTFSGAVNVFRAPKGSDAPEFYTDPREQAAAIHRMRRGYLLEILALIPILGIWFLLVSGLEGGVGNLWAELVRRFVTITGVVLLYGVFLLSALYNIAAGLVRTTRLIRRLKRGTSLDHAPKGRGRVHLYVYITLFLLCLALVVGELASYRRSDLPRIPEGPYTVLSELGFEGRRIGILGKTDESRLETVHSLMADIWQTRETVAYGENWVTLDQDVYSLRVPALTEPFARALLEDGLFTRSADEYEERAVPGFDAVYASAMEWVAVRGNMVIHLYMLLPGDFTAEERSAVFEEALVLIADRL